MLKNAGFGPVWVVICRSIDAAIISEIARMIRVAGFDYPALEPVDLHNADPVFHALSPAKKMPRAGQLARGGPAQSPGFQMIANVFSSSCPAARPRLA